MTADLVRVRRRKGELQVLDLKDEALERAISLAAVYLGVAEEHIGKTREQLEEALDEIEVEPGDQKIAQGIRKLLEDRCRFEEPAMASPEELRREVFLKAVEARRSAAPHEPFDRDRILGEVARARGLDPLTLEASLYADLRSSNLLKGIEPTTPQGLIEAYRAALPQAVLLRAVRVSVLVRCNSPGAYRALFHKLKFLRLLYDIHPEEDGRYRIEIEGPFSMFEAVTRYGLKLALLLPHLEACAEYELTADVRWGKERERFIFRRRGGSRIDAADLEPPRLPDEVAALVEGFRKLSTIWKVSISSALLSLPGVGLCVPDLVFEHGGTGERVYLEVMGFWSREAVWRRVDLVENGLSERILFAVSERLRVSEDVLGDSLPGALYVYKGVMSPRLIAERIEALRKRPIRKG
ncbi:MAG: DUF790 family protein [Polyangiaceae bacterium]|nr:DUF790 family protein [Polyangiaceae bacterium]